MREWFRRGWYAWGSVGGDRRGGGLSRRQGDVLEAHGDELLDELGVSDLAVGVELDLQLFAQVAVGVGVLVRVLLIRVVDRLQHSAEVAVGHVAVGVLLPIELRHRPPMGVGRVCTIDIIGLELLDDLLGAHGLEQGVVEPRERSLLPDFEHHRSAVHEASLVRLLLDA